MRFPHRLAALLSILCLSACDWPFNTQPTIDDAIFKISAQLQTERIVSFAYVDLSWPSVGVDDFREIRVTRAYTNQQDTLEDQWLTRAIIDNPYTTAWRDTLFDDESVSYRLMVYRLTGPAGDSQVDVVVPPTTSLTVPVEIQPLAATMESPLIDDGDTVYVLPGKYDVDSLDFQGRAIHLIGTGGAANTCLMGLADESLGGATIDPMVMIRMDAGLIEGFTIAEGASELGGAVEATGSMVVRQCAIVNNLAIPWYGAEVTAISGCGGGLLLGGDARVENCLIYNNMAIRDGDGIFVTEDAQNVRVVNCTVYSNQGSGIHIARDGVTIENCIVVGNRDGNVHAFPQEDYPYVIVYSNAGEKWTEVDSTNIWDVPGFVDTTLASVYLVPDLRLLPDSPCIDAGNPDPAYNDPDGSRNDMGAFGGPYGEWEPIGCYTTPDP
ncbi:MAG: right-handed parallel beta-helix repeat-containing protein [Fidelibacterota bacterium]|nr:MAG: right-handed parallel beta-helix repeat-containing protein [Candidatus Neomarinimicrobiota bacterium]